MSRRQEAPARARARRWQEGEGRAMVDAWRQSGDSLAAFARRRGLHEQRLRYWVARLAVRSTPRAPSLRFHPVQLVDEAGAMDRPAIRSDDRIEILLPGGRIVRVPPGVATEELRQVLRALDTAR
jgi:transposase